MGIANNDEQCLGPGHGHVEAFGVAKETQVVININRGFFVTGSHLQIYTITAMDNDGCQTRAEFCTPQTGQITKSL